MPVQKVSITQDQVATDLNNVVVFLRTLESVMPGGIVMEGAIEALQAIASSQALLSLLTTALQKV